MIAVLERIRADSREIDKTRRYLERLHERNDKNVVKARRGGIKFREIADASGRSVSWVQAAVRRADPSIITPRPRAVQENGSEADADDAEVDA